MRGFLLTLASLAVLVLTALFALPPFIDWNAHRGIFEQQMSDVLGREVRVGGATSLRLLPAPYLRFENVRIADATGRFDTPLLRMEAFTVWLSPAPLLTGTLAAREVQIIEPELRLALDESGRGNWQGLGQGRSTLPFLPADVTLQSVDILRGRVSFVPPGNRAPIEAVGITGELSATSLSGPFRFRGTLDQAQEPLALRLSTSQFAAGENVRLTAHVQAPRTGSTLQLDGELTTAEGLPKFTGRLDAALAYATTAASESAPEYLQRVDIGGQVDADLAKAKIDQLVMSFDSDGRQQQIEGSLAAVFGAPTTIDGALTARWLDLDRIAGSVPAAGPVPALARLAGLLSDGRLTSLAAKLDVGIEQAMLGGDSVADVKFGLGIADGRISISNFGARLPGAARFEASGQLDAGDRGLKFSGPVLAHGTSLARLLRWAAPEIASARAADEGRFLVEAQAQAGPDGIVAEALRVEVKGNRAEGYARYVPGVRPMLEVKVASDRLDLDAVLPALGEVALGTVLSQLKLAKAPPEAPLETASTTRAPQWPARLDALDSAIDVRIGELITGGRTWRDLQVSLLQSKESLEIKALSAASSDGLRLSAHGALSRASASPVGEFRLDFDAESEEALRPTVETLRPWIPASVDRLTARLAPVRLASLVAFGRRGAGSIDILTGGNAAGGRLDAAARFDGWTDSAETKAVDVRVDLSHGDGRQLAALIAGIQPASSPTPPAQSPARLQIRAIGGMGEALTTIATFEAPELAITFDGKARTSGEMAGQVMLRAASTAQALALLGVEASVAPAEPQNASGGEESDTLDLVAQLRSSEKAVVIEAITGRLGGLSASGNISVALAGAPIAIQVRGKVDEIALSSLSNLLTRPRSTVVAASFVESPLPDLWTERSFDFARVSGVKIDVGLDARRLSVSAGLGLTEVKLAAIVDATGFQLDSLEGKGLGGTVKVTGAIRPQGGGAALQLTGDLRDGQLARLLDGVRSDTPAEGRLAAHIEASGKAVGPGSLLSVLSGEGSIEIGTGRIAGLSPMTIDGAVRAALAESGKVSPDEVRRWIDRRRRLGTFPVSGASAPLSLRDGRLTLAPLSLESPEAKLQIAAELDLVGLKLSSEARLVPLPATAGRAPLPPVTLSYTGPLAALGTIEATTAADDLAVDLNVRRLLDEPSRLEGIRPDPLADLASQSSTGEPTAGTWSTTTEPNRTRAPARKISPVPKRAKKSLVAPVPMPLVRSEIAGPGAR